MTTTRAVDNRSDLVGLTARYKGEWSGWDARIYRRADGPLGIRLHQWSAIQGSMSGEVAVTPLLPADLVSIEHAETEARACGDEPRDAAMAALSDLVDAIQSCEDPHTSRTWRVIRRAELVR